MTERAYPIPVDDRSTDAAVFAVADVLQYYGFPFIPDGADMLALAIAVETFLYGRPRPRRCSVCQQPAEYVTEGRDPFWRHIELRSHGALPVAPSERDLPPPREAR